MNFFEKAIEFISPQAAVKRQYAREQLSALNSGYGNYGANHSKSSMSAWNYGSNSADEDIHENLQTLRERCRDLYMGVPLATGSLKTLRTNIIGAGLKLKSQIDYEVVGISEEEAQKLENQIEREFALWAETTDCDLERFDTFYELQQLVFLNWIMSGDVFVLLPETVRVNQPYNLRIQLIEADRVLSPASELTNENLVAGVETNNIGEIIAYYISKKHPKSELNISEEFTRVEAFGDKTGRRNVLHIMNRERIGQKRGIPLLAPVIESLKQIGTYTQAELKAAVVTGMFAAFIKHANIEYDGSETGEQEVYSHDDLREIGSGSIGHLNPGEEIEQVNPQRPNPNYGGFVDTILEQIGVALGMGKEMMKMSFNSNYSASRAALLEFWKNVRMYRSWMSNDFCQPIYEEWLTEAVAKGRIKAKGFMSSPLIRRAYCGAEWNGAAQGSLDPFKEAKSYELLVANGFITRDKATQEITGTDYYKNVSGLKRENKLLREANGNAELLEVSKSSKRGESDDNSEDEREKDG